VEPKVIQKRVLAGRAIVVIGAASGIGAASSRLISQFRARVVLADKDADGLRRQQQRMLPSAPATVAVPVDVTNPASIERLCDRATARFGRVDAVVNCAGVIHPGAFSDTDPTLIREQVDVNLLGTINVSRVFLAQFGSQQNGHLVHIASLGGIAPLPYSAIYSATKFAVRGFCMSLALELRNSPIDVSVICPDSVDTPQLLREAVQRGSPLSFIDAPLEAAIVARSIVATLERPKTETLVPRISGWLSLLAGASPGLLRLSYPLLSGLGERRRARYSKRATASSELTPRLQELGDA
jgi:short-subunit dehydrogenase